MPTDLELVLRLGAAALLGGAVGLEREISDQPAGFRTHILVALGSCLFAVISAYGFEPFLDDDRVSFDPSRLSAQIVSGIGFLGAGAILRYGATVRGLTTAASLWVVAAVGLAAALGAYLLASVTTGITVVSLWGLKHVRRVLVRGLKPEHEEFTLEVASDGRLEDVVGALAGEDVSIRHVRMDEEEGAQVISLFLRMGPGLKPEDVVGLLSRLPNVRTVDWTR
ncbi:MAG TPA: MgtC/SapB family protein [Actinomycetota bacterium]|jgi:putative Mg2+ transporter-C (MgtC) family protein